MWWPILTAVAFIGLAAVHFYWRRKYARLAERLEDHRTEQAALDKSRQQAELQTQTQQQALFNSMVEGVLLLDGEGKVRLANRALERLFGVTADIRGLTIMEALRLHELQELAQRVNREGQVLGFEIEPPGLDRRCLQVNAAAVHDRNGESRGAVLVFHDLTRLKQLEDTRKDFVANVSHELRTPLSMIKGYVETLLDGAKDDPAVATRFLQTIEKNTDRLTYLIEDLLSIARLESGRIVLNLQQVEVHSLVEDVVNDLQSLAADRSVVLDNQVACDLVVRADGDRLRQVIFNLVDNAIKYGRAGGHVWISAGPSDGGMVEITVRDDGPGIPDEATDRIFERFYRVDKARSRDQGGTGLGLAIVKHIVQSHAGEVRVQSTLGQGAAFSFTVPAG